jgi:hypothetical protein
MFSDIKTHWSQTKFLRSRRIEVDDFSMLVRKYSAYIMRCDAMRCDARRTLMSLIDTDNCKHDIVHRRLAACTSPPVSTVARPPGNKMPRTLRTTYLKVLWQQYPHSSAGSASSAAAWSIPEVVPCFWVSLRRIRARPGHSQRSWQKDPRQPSRQWGHHLFLSKKGALLLPASPAQGSHKCCYPESVLYLTLSASFA